MRFKAHIGGKRAQHCEVNLNSAGVPPGRADHDHDAHFTLIGLAALGPGPCQRRPQLERFATCHAAGGHPPQGGPRHAAVMPTRSGPGAVQAAARVYSGWQPSLGSGAGCQRALRLTARGTSPNLTLVRRLPLNRSPIRLAGNNLKFDPGPLGPNPRHAPPEKVRTLGFKLPWAAAEVRWAPEHGTGPRERRGASNAKYCVARGRADTTTLVPSQAARPSRF
jgi:hypothetical protein